MNEKFEFKSAASGAIALDELQGIVECFVAGIGNKDSVGDIVVTGAFAKSLTRRKPRVVWAHSWNDPIGKVLEMYEVPAGDPRLPAKMRNAGIGGLYAKVQFNLQSEKGKEAFASVAFFGEEQEWSIGYKTINGAFDPAQQANVLREVELYEVSPVLHGANQLTGTISVKSEQKNHMMPVIAGMPMMNEQQQPRMIVIAAPEKEQEEDEPFNIFAEGLAQPLEADKVQKIQAELSERTGSKVDIVEATDSFIVFRRTTSDGKVSMYRVGYHSPDDYNTFMFGKPEVYSGSTDKPQMQQEIEVKPADESMVPAQPQQMPYRDDDQDEMNTMLGGQVGVGKSAYAHLIEIPQIHMMQAKSMLQPVFNYHNLSTTDSDNGIIVNGSISAQAIDALRTAVKAIGQTIGQSVGNLRTLAQSFNPFAIDGDNDGFAQDGTTFQRPYIPIKKPDMNLPEVGGKNRDSNELLDKPTIRTGKKPMKDPSLLSGAERQEALAAGDLQPRTMDDISFLANRRPENEGIAKYWDMPEEGLRAEGQKLVAARREQTGSAREATDGELFKISHEFARREAYKQQFGKDFVPPKRTESTGRETFDASKPDEVMQEIPMSAVLDAMKEWSKSRSTRGFGSRGDVTPEQQSRIDASRKRGSDVASGRGQILADNIANLSDEDKDYIRENGIVSYLLQDGTGGPLSGEWAGDSPAERIGDLLPEGDWSTDSKLQADAEDIFASYEEGFYAELDKDFAERANPADLDTPKAKRDRQRAAGQGEMFSEDDFDNLSADEQDAILEQGRDGARGFASRGEGSGLWGSNRSIDPDDDELSDEFIEDYLNDYVGNGELEFDKLEKFNDKPEYFNRGREPLSDAELQDLFDRYQSDDDAVREIAADEITTRFYRELLDDQYDYMVEQANSKPDYDDYEDYQRSRGFYSRGDRLDVQGTNNELNKWWSSYDELTDSEKSDIEQAYFKRNPSSERPGSRAYNPEVAQEDFESNPEKYGYAKDFRAEAYSALMANGADRTQAQNVTEYWMENDALHDEYLKEADGDSLYAMALAYDNYIEAAADDYNERQRGFGSRSYRTNPNGTPSDGYVVMSDGQSEIRFALEDGDGIYDATRDGYRVVREVGGSRYPESTATYGGSGLGKDEQKEILDTLKGSSDPFVQKLLGDFNKRGRLSDKQWATLKGKADREKKKNAAKKPSGFVDGRVNGGTIAPGGRPVVSAGKDSIVSPTAEQIADADGLEKLINDARRDGQTLRFNYNGKDREVFPVQTFKNPKTGKVNMVGQDSEGVKKTFTIDKMSPSSNAGGFASRGGEMQEMRPYEDFTSREQEDLYESIENYLNGRGDWARVKNELEEGGFDYDDFLQENPDFHPDFADFGDAGDMGFASRSFDPADAPEYDDSEVRDYYDDEVLTWASDASLEDFMELNYPSKYRNETADPFTEEELTKLYNDGNFEDIVAMLPDQIADKYGDDFTERAQERIDDNFSIGAADAALDRRDAGFASRGSKPPSAAKLQELISDRLGAREDDSRIPKPLRDYSKALLENWNSLTPAQKNEVFADTENSERSNLSAEDFLEVLESAWQSHAYKNEKFSALDDELRYIMEDNDMSGFASRGTAAKRTVKDFDRINSGFDARSIEDSEPYERVERLKDSKAELTAAIDEAEKMLDGLDEDSPEWEELYSAQSEMESNLIDVENMMEEMISEKGRLEDAMGEAATMVSDAEELRKTRQNIDTPSEEDLQEMSFEDANFEYLSLSDDITEFVNENDLSVDWNPEKQAEVEKALRDGDYDKANDILYDATQEIFDAADDKYRTAEAEHDEYPFVSDDYGFASRGGSRFDTVETPNSSAIEAVHYDRNTRELHVAFKPGQTGGEARYYTYSDVSPDYFDNEVAGSNSIGRVINDVKKNHDVEITNANTIDAINGREDAESDDMLNQVLQLRDEIGSLSESDLTDLADEAKRSLARDGFDGYELSDEYGEPNSLVEERMIEIFESRGSKPSSAGKNTSKIQDIDVRRSGALSESYYDPNTEELVVTFKGKDGAPGGSYIYEGVTADEAKELASSSSKGKVINKLKASKPVRRASATDRMDRDPSAGEDVGSGSFDAQVDSHWGEIGPDEQRRYFARAVDSAINAGSGTSAEEITADAKARAFDDRQIAMMEMQAESLGIGYRNVDVGSSAALNRVQYDQDKRELRVEYRGRDGKGTGEFYVYENVPQSVVDDLEASDSRGSTLRRVRDDFDFRREEAIPESAFYSMGEPAERSNPKITNRTNENGFYLDENGKATNYNKRAYTTGDVQKMNARRNGRDGFASMGQELQDLQSKIQIDLKNPGSRNGKRNKPIDPDVAANLANPESDAGTLVYPSTNEGDYIRISYNPEKRKYSVERIQTVRGFNRDEPPEEVVVDTADADTSYEAGSLVREFAENYVNELRLENDNDRRSATYGSTFGRGGDADDGFASRGGTSKLSRDYPYSIDVEKPLEEENAIAGQLMRVNRYQNLDVPEYEPTPSAMPWKSLSPSQKERYGRDILRKNQEYFDRLRQNGASSEEIDYEIAQIHNEFAKGELISLERTLKMAKEDFYESARRRLEQANPSMSQNEIDDMLVDLGLSENDFDQLFAKNMDIFELAAVAADLESRRRDIVRIATPKTGGDRPKVDPLSILGGYSDGDVFGLTPRGFASRGASGSKKKTKEEVYAEMTKQLIDALSESEKLGKWQLPWRRMGMPENGTSGHKYSGSNWFFLTAMADIKGYNSNKWATYDQWQGIGGQVRKGEKATSIFVPIFLKGKEKADGTEEKGRISFISRSVFNLDQIDGMPADFDKKEILPESERVADLEKTISEIPAVIKNGGDEAYFSPSEDFIQLPLFENFKDARAYYSTAAHELMHWTGGKDRLGRENMNRFGTPEYAYEELVAEIASAMFMAAHNIEPNIQDNHGPYLASWIKKLKDDPTALERAMKDAQSAVNYVLDVSPNAKSKFSNGEKAVFENPDIAVPTEAVVAVEGFASRGDWPTPGGYEPGEFDMRTALSQIGRGNLMAISGTRANKRNNEMVLPVNRNQQVIIGYDGGSDTYFVRAEQIITNGKDKGKTRVLGQWDNVYADELGETAYQASLKPSMLSDENKTVWAQAFDHPQTGSLLDENGRVYENGFASGGDSMDPDELDAMDWAYDAAQDYLMEKEDMMPEEISPEDGFASRVNLSREEKNEIIAIARRMGNRFTTSVVGQYDRNGELSDKQWDALNRMTLRKQGNSYVRNTRGLASRGDKKPRTPKASWSPEDRQRYADGDKLRSTRRPGKRREGPSASEYGFSSRGEPIDMIPSDIFIGDDGAGRSWGFEPIIRRAARKFDGQENMSDEQLAAELRVPLEVAKKMRKQGARTRDVYLLDNLRMQVGGDRDLWGVENDPLSYYDESGNPILNEDDIPDTGDLSPDAPGARPIRLANRKEYLDPRPVLEEIGISETASQYSVAKTNSAIFSERTWRRIFAQGITRDEVNTLLEAKKSEMTADSIYGEKQPVKRVASRTDSLPLADIFGNRAFDSVRGRRGFPQQVADTIFEITGRKPSISTVKKFINDPQSSGRAAGRVPFSLNPLELKQLLEKLGISSEEFDKFRSE